MSFLSHINLRYSLLLFIAATTAFALAVFLKIPNPYWAVMPVWIIVQKSREEIFEKGFWRIVGTGAGALLSVVALYVPTTFLKLFLIALILGVTSGLTHAFRGLSGYGLQMLGITIGAILLPAIFHPETVESLSWARFLCTILGVFAIGLFTYWYLPKSPMAQLYKDLKIFHAKVSSAPTPRGKLVSELVDLEQRFHSTLTLFSSKNLSRQYETYFIECLDFLLQKRSMPPHLFVPDENVGRGVNLRYRFDPHLSLRVGSAIFLIGLVGSCIGLYSGWRFGHLLAMGFCVLSAVLGGMSIPKKMAPHMVVGVILGANVAMLYRLFLQRYMFESWEVILWTSPILLIGALLRTHDKYKLASVDFNMIFLLAGQVGMSPLTSSWDVVESTLPILIAGVTVTSIYIYFPRPYLNLAKNHKANYLKTNATSSLLQYLTLLKLNNSDESAYEQFIEQFKSPGKVES